MNVLLKVSFLFLIKFSVLSTDQFSDQVYAKISDLSNPSYEDYQAIEFYLNYGYRPYLNRLDPWQYKGKARNLKLLPESGKTIQHEIIPINCDRNNLENCIILYTTFNFNYAESLLKLIELIKKSDFVGHIIYRIGGWPNVEDGDLALSHIPYAFKISAFREAYRLGFKRALWLDSPMRPTISLNSIFENINNLGIFTYKLPYSIEDLCPCGGRVSSYKALQIYAHEAKGFYSILSGVIGIDFTNPTSLEIFNQWYHLTKYREVASYTYRLETTLFSVILNRFFTECPFRTYESHINCNDPSTNEFNYSKIEVQPNWPN